MSKRRNDALDSSSKKGKASVELRVSLEDKVQYVGQYFTVSVLLLGMDGQLHTGELNKITLKRPQLHIQDNHNHNQLQVDDSNSLEIEDWNPKLERGRAMFKAKIDTLSRDAAGRQFSISVDADDSSVPASYSLPITVVSYKLAFLSEIPNKWYNQMGGGGNCITLDIACRDGQGGLVETSVPLEVILVYSDDGETVRTQEILTKSDDSQMATQGGRATMKVRIEHVSRKHQNRLFAIKVTPNLSVDPLSANVAPVVSTPINVLSKITPRDRRTNDKKLSSSTSFDDSTPEPSSSSNFAQQPLMLPSKFIATSTNHEAAYHHIVNQAPASIAAPISDEDDSPTVGGYGNLLAATAPNGNNNMANQNNNPTNGPPIVQALSNVLGWIDSTLKCLCESKWQQVGYEQAPDSTSDYNRPLYSMSNPNDRIQSQLDSYRNKVMGSLSVVLEGIEPLLEEQQQKFQQQQESLGSSGIGSEEVNQHHPEPLSGFGSETVDAPKPELARSGSSGIPGSVEFDTLVSSVGHYDASSDPMLPLLRGLSRGFSDYNGQI